MEDSLDRPATDEEIAEVERLLKATKKVEIVPLPKPRPVPKTSTELLAMPTLPALQLARSLATPPGSRPQSEGVIQ